MITICSWFEHILEQLMEALKGTYSLVALGGYHLISKMFPLPANIQREWHGEAPFDIIP